MYFLISICQNITTFSSNIFLSHTVSLHKISQSQMPSLIKPVVSSGVNPEFVKILDVMTSFGEDFISSAAFTISSGMSLVQWQFYKRTGLGN